MHSSLTQWISSSATLKAAVW